MKSTTADNNNQQQDPGASGPERGSFSSFHPHDTSTNGINSAGPEDSSHLQQNHLNSQQQQDGNSSNDPESGNHQPEQPSRNSNFIPSTSSPTISTTTSSSPGGGHETSTITTNTTISRIISSSNQQNPPVKSEPESPTTPTNKLPTGGLLLGPPAPPPPLRSNSVSVLPSSQQQQATNPEPRGSAPPGTNPSVTSSTTSSTSSSSSSSSLTSAAGPIANHNQQVNPTSNNSNPSPAPNMMDSYHAHHGGGGLHSGPLTHAQLAAHHAAVASGAASPQTILSMASQGGGGIVPGTLTPSSLMSNISVVTVASSSPNCEPKECIEEACPVCGDRVSGYHYGLLTCESCKGFFKRTVQNKKVYTCVAERNCHIDKSQRKRCPYCRFQKCLEVGMKLEAVRADRMRGGRNKFGPMYKRDRARRLQIMRQKQLVKVSHGGHHHGGHHGGSHVGGHHGGGGGHGGHLGPPGATMLPGGELNFLHGGGHHGHGGHGGGHHTTIFDGVKQELIQIPQLSSSTSSPDSSPSPGVAGGGPPGSGQNPLTAAAAAAAAAAAVAAGGHQGPGGLGGHGQGGHQGGNHPSFMSQLSISTAHPGMTNQSSAAAAAVDHLLKSWPNGTSGSSSSPLLAGTSKTNNNSSSTSTSSSYHESSGVGGPGNGSSSAANGSSGGAGAQQVVGPNGKFLPTLVREFQSTMLDDKEWQAQLFGLLQNQTYNQCEVDLFELMCKVIDQSLFAQVDWARNSIFFKDLKVDDQMKLLQHAWSDMLVLDHIHQRMHVGLPDETPLANGQKFDLMSLALLGVPQCAEQLHRVVARLQDLKIDANDYICLKFLLLLNPDVRGLTNYKLVQEAHEQTRQAIHDYTVNFYPQIGDKFQQIMSLVPEIRALTLRGEDFLYYKHMNGSAPTQTLLMEMLHAKKK